MSPSPTIYSPVQLANYLKLVRQKNQWTQSELANTVFLAPVVTLFFSIVSFQEPIL